MLQKLDQSPQCEGRDILLKKHSNKLKDCMYFKPNVIINADRIERKVLSNSDGTQINHFYLFLLHRVVFNHAYYCFTLSAEFLENKFPKN